MNEDAGVKFGFDRVLFFGRSIGEYRTMFNFDPAEFQGKRILDCSAGPAALCATGAVLGLHVVACDPLYQSSLGELRQRADDDARTVDQLQAKTMPLFDEQVRRADIRRRDMDVFLADFEKGKRDGRYVVGELPNLPFENKTFDLTLCANFLFLYSSMRTGGLMLHSPFDYDFHLASLRELCRVTKEEVRLYPLNGPQTERHVYLDDVCAALTADGVKCELMAVAHQDIKTAKHLLSLQP